ncbi:MAG: response regulator transcription factor [Rhodobacteraceae bacterium]|nr:response regulator transcription factor [Paracoccaceae bacterium]
MFDSHQPTSQDFRQDNGRSEFVKARILVVDNEHDIREFLKVALSASGYFDVEVASNASEALLAMDKLTGAFDCLLVDIQMPLVSGIDLCAVVRQNPEYSSVPIIMLTAMSDRKYLDSAFSKGATDYVSKPFDVMDLRMRIGRARKNTLRQPHCAKEAPSHLSVETANQLAGPLKLDQPTYLVGIDRCVHPDAFENYVLQSSSQGLQCSFVSAVKIANIQWFHRTLSKNAYLGVLRCVAELLSDETSLCGGVLSYRENGIFLQLGQCNVTLARVVANRQATRDSYLENIRKVSGHHIKLTFGDRLPVSGASKSGVLFKMNKAIEDVEAKDKQSKKWSNYSEWQVEQAACGTERDHIELSAYKNLLQDMQLEKNYRPQ